MKTKPLEHRIMQKNGVTWTFKPAAAAHHGGMWELMIKIILLSVINS